MNKIDRTMWIVIAAVAIIAIGGYITFQSTSEDEQADTNEVGS